MKRILHLSDLHFGRVHEPALDALREVVIEQEKGFDLIVVTGDWTHRARPEQFREAAEFVRGLSCPVLSVPGNHDVPLYDLGRRFLAPYSRYAEIRRLTRSQYLDDEISVIGLSTVDPFQILAESLRSRKPVGAGAVHRRDYERAIDHFAATPPGTLKIIACHHPLYDPRVSSWLSPESRSKALLRLRPDVILSGNSHMQWVETSGFESRQVLHISAGTSISDRLREQVNSFHILEIQTAHETSDRKKSVIVKTYDLTEDGFLERGLRPRNYSFENGVLF